MEEVVLVAGLVAIVATGIWCLPITMRITPEKFRLEVGKCKRATSD